MSIDDKRKLTLATSINPDLLNLIYDSNQEIITNITILTVDYKPVELILDVYAKPRYKKVSDVVTIYDVAALIVKSIAKDSDSKDNNKEKTKFIMSEDIVRVSNDFGDLVMLNGRIDVIPDKMLVDVYKNFSNLKSVNLEQLEDILEISKNQPALKAYSQLSNYFSAENYSKNNNVFKLLQHQNDVVKVSKKILLKSMVAWEIRK